MPRPYFNCHALNYPFDSDEHRDKHATQCAELLHCMAADVYESSVSIANPPIPTDIDSEYMTTSDLDMKQYLHITLGRNNNQKLSDIQILHLKFLSDRLSGPLTLYHVMKSFGLKRGDHISDRGELVIHIVGAALQEMVGIKKWEFLHHRLPKCHRLKYEVTNYHGIPPPPKKN